MFAKTDNIGSEYYGNFSFEVTFGHKLIVVSIFLLFRSHSALIHTADNIFFDPMPFKGRVIHVGVLFLHN